MNFKIVKQSNVIQRLKTYKITVNRIPSAVWSDFVRRLVGFRSPSGRIPSAEHHRVLKNYI